MKRTGWLMLVVLFAAAGPGDARIVVQKKGRAVLDCPAPGPLTLADTIHVNLAVEGGPALVVDAPGEMPADSGWLLIERQAPVREPLGANRDRWHFTYGFAPRAPGERVAFAFPDVKIRDGKDEETVAFAPVFYRVTTQIKDADLAQLRDITAIEPLPPIDASDSAWPWWASMAAASFVALLCMIVTIVLAWRWWRRLAVRSPAQLALWEWRRLAAMNLAEKGQSERFITLLTTLVRRFLERQFTLPARRQTTPEFLRDLARSAALTADEKRFLETFFDRCETVKFARADMSFAECGHWAEAARQFLEGRSRGQASPILAVEKNAQSG